MTLGALEWAAGLCAGRRGAHAMLPLAPICWGAG